MRVFGLIGYPLGHSFSGLYFTDKFRNEGINAIYRNYELEDLSSFSEVLRSNKDIEGLNITIPYKSAIIEYLDYIDPLAKEIGAVNVIRVLRTKNDIKLKGYNTDIIGFRRSLSPALNPNVLTALILGTGGSSLAVRKGLTDLGIEYKTVSRSKEKGHLAYAEINEDIIKSCQLIINTTPLGMFPDIDGHPDIPYEFLGNEHILFDLVYNPHITRFLSEGKERGCTAISGLEMLHIQAEEAWKIWNTDD